VAEAGLAYAEDLEILDFCAYAKPHVRDSRFIRAEGLNSADQASLIKTIWAACSDDIAGRAPVSANQSTIRVRKLPLR
jgi:hypothetical protein